MIPYGKQSIRDDDINSVVKVLKSDFLTTGPKVSEFENSLVKYCGVKYVVAVCNGTAALHLAYLAAGLKTGDEVIVSPNTFVATTNMILAVGAKPVFCDIRLDTYNIDETKITKLLTKKTKAIVAVDFAGQPAEYQKIKNICKKYKLLLIEDAAHSLGADYHGRKAGNLGDVATMSFHPVKSITTGEGGVVLTNNKDIWERLIKFRNHGTTKDRRGFNVMTDFGYNYRLTDIQAALGINQLSRLNKFVNTRRKLANRYINQLKSVSQIILPLEQKDLHSSWHLFVIRTKKAYDRLPLYNFLKTKGIGVNFHYPTVYSQPFYRRNGYAKTKLKNADIYASQAITIPLFPALNLEQQDYVVNSIKEYYKMSS
ncbi:MAG: UDP-4-amino-4,6-dideoxy-N-acetyl-beta-L-altrosamine transaminase [Patescibacteria group bacterium]|jgi:UDP-4-amino-4,6-dideoxy-N-acetyl-beta-L-altrosamine transaminase|nr:UDP-4-amino-4,6-dideoxy-N-acetyl-beta-L-altrosamine transaminase [Patescibacteria group bacterium]